MIEFALANIVRVDFITEEETPVTHKLTDVATEAKVEAFISAGAENELRVKNVIKAQNNTEDIVKGYNTTLTAATLIPEILALVDGGVATLETDATITSEIPTGAIDEDNKVYTLSKANVVAGTVSIVVDEGAAITDDTGDLSDGGTINYIAGTFTLFAAPQTSITVTYDYALAEGIFDKYEAPAIGTPVARTPFTTKIYTADKDVDGEDKGYVCFEFLHSKGTPVSYSLVDGEFSFLN